MIGTEVDGTKQPQDEIMLAWELLDSAPVPGASGVMRLYRRGHEFSIRVDDRELMASGVHGSEEALADIPCKVLAGREQVRILIGGLGMGYTLAAALRTLPKDARVTVAELVPSIVAWNRTVIGHVAGHPLSHPRVDVVIGDVGDLLRQEGVSFDGVLLDVDNGPRALSSPANGWLYSPQGLRRSWEILRPGGALAVWSAAPDQSFTSRLNQAGFRVTEHVVRARGTRGGRRHTIWLAVREA